MSASCLSKYCGHLLHGDSTIRYALLCGGTAGVCCFVGVNPGVCDVLCSFVFQCVQLDMELSLLHRNFQHMFSPETLTLLERAQIYIASCCQENFHRQRGGWFPLEGVQQKGWRVPFSFLTRGNGFVHLRALCGPSSKKPLYFPSLRNFLLGSCGEMHLAVFMCVFLFCMCFLCTCLKK